MCTGRREPGSEEGGIRQGCRDPWHLSAGKVLQVDISRVAESREDRYTWGEENWRSNLTHVGHGIWFEQVAIISSECPPKTSWRKIQETVYEEHLWQGWYLWPLDGQREYLLNSVSTDLIVQREHLLVSGWQITMQRDPKVFFPDVAMSISRYIDPCMPWDWHENTITHQTCHFLQDQKICCLELPTSAWYPKLCSWSQKGSLLKLPWHFCNGVLDAYCQRKECKHIFPKIIRYLLLYLHAMLMKWTPFSTSSVWEQCWAKE